MKANLLLKTGLGALVALALTVATPGSPALAQDINSLYFTPKIVYSYQEGDMAPAQWSDGGGWKREVLEGEKEDKGYGLGFSVGNDLGYYYDMPVRVELEYMYRAEASWSDGPKSVTLNGGVLQASQGFDITAHSVLFNAFYDFNTQTNLTPYIGGGIGVAYLSTNYKNTVTQNGGSSNSTNSNTNFNFAWNVGGGLAYHFSDTMALDFGYRYVDLGTGSAGDISIDTFKAEAEVDYTSHEFGVGLRFSGF